MPPKLEKESIAQPCVPGLLTFIVIDRAARPSPIKSNSGTTLSMRSAPYEPMPSVQMSLMALSAPLPPISNGCRERSSYSMRASLLPGGELVGARSVQVVPSYANVSASFDVPESPPNITTAFCSALKAMAAPLRAVGVNVEVVSSVQLQQFHRQVSLLRAPPEERPPKSTVCSRSGSKTIAADVRADGCSLGACSCQSVPSHSQVSLLVAPSSPPKSTSFWLFEL
ncbi:MAG: hypothetical protein HY816_18315 [Candidatus Wallbacteria bacterium]|nr:hypothetical protein [Candidatus Wallbacteria bacterium]